MFRSVAVKDVLGSRVETKWLSTTMRFVDDICFADVVTKVEERRGTRHVESKAGCTPAGNCDDANRD